MYSVCSQSKLLHSVSCKSLWLLWWGMQIWKLKETYNSSWTDSLMADYSLYSINPSLSPWLLCHNSQSMETFNIDFCCGRTCTSYGIYIVYTYIVWASQLTLWSGLSVAHKHIFQQNLKYTSSDDCILNVHRN